MGNTMKFIAALAGCVALFWIFVFAFIYLMGTIECNSISKYQGMETSYDGFYCYRKVGDKWLTGAQYQMYIINNFKETKDAR